MSKTTRQMLLYCDVANSVFILTAAGEDWRQTFKSFERAYAEAEERTTETIPLILYTEDGRQILEATVSAAPPELVQLSHPFMGRRTNGQDAYLNR
ncbi:MAG: hypothetical protein ABJF10_25560 [Chthoniobacter sp.]|uniref:hypothetical protein n=1 Tax=Chthoniobacter sp. TaxID=2510640 RepID=UPI0032AB4149